jgi:hypothetical protein
MLHLICRLVLRQGRGGGYCRSGRRPRRIHASSNHTIVNLLTSIQLHRLNIRVFHITSKYSSSFYETLKDNIEEHTTEVGKTLVFICSILNITTTF